MAENPPLNRIYVLGYSANDRDFPLVSMNLDPRVAGYKVPEDLSACPDKRYPNHVFTGAQPLSGDERVRHVWEILPSPTVPFTRYDDDLGPVQGRRRSVKNEGQVAVRQADKQTTYEAREGSAIVYTELEEAWSITTDDDGNSLFPIKTRDFYDEKFGSVQEVRQIIVPTGEEVGSLTYSAPTVTQISYEPYNDYLVAKVTRTFDLPCPQRNDEVYDVNRGQVQRISEVVIDTKDLSGSLVELGGTVTQISYQQINELLLDRTIETWTAAGPIRDGKQTGLWGIETSTSKLVPNSEEVEFGFGVKSGALVPISSEQREIRTENYPTDEDGDGIVYTLKGQEQDETTRAIISVEKSLVDASQIESGDVADYISNLRSDNYVVEVQPLDKWHSITVASKVTGAPQNESWTETGSIDLPDVLQEVGVIWDSNTEKDAGAAGVNNISTIVEREYSWQLVASGTIRGTVVGRPYIKTKAGFHGAARMNVSRIFYFGAPADIISIHKFEPVYGTLSIFGRSSEITRRSYAAGKGDVDITSGSSSSFKNDTSMIIDQFGPVEWSGILTIQNNGDSKTVSDTISASGGSIPGGGLYPAISASINLSGVANLELPASSIPKTSGGTFIRQVNVQPWRLGWWVREVYTAVVP